MIKILPVTEADLSDIQFIEKQCFSVPWSIIMLQDELKYGAFMFKAVIEGKTIGYGGFRKIIDEGYINNIAVLSEYRGMGAGKLIVNEMLEVAKALEITGITLEVRKSNEKAIRLYTSCGFKNVGIRPKYYPDDEDAVIMWNYL